MCKLNAPVGDARDGLLRRLSVNVAHSSLASWTLTNSAGTILSTGVRSYSQPLKALTLQDPGKDQ